VAALCWLGNQASFEIHAWTGRLPEPWRPTFAYIDIDPGDATTWEETLVLARLYRTALGHLGVRGYPKTTGKRGIQVWIPIVPRYGFDETSGWVERVSRAVGAIVPDLVSWEWAKGARKGRARLDYTQNASIKTLCRPVRGPSRSGCPGVRADRLGGARRPRPAPRPLDHPDDRRARRRAGRPVRGGPDRRPGAAQRLRQGLSRAAANREHRIVADVQGGHGPAQLDGRGRDDQVDHAAVVGESIRSTTLAASKWHDAFVHDETVRLRQPDAESLRAWSLVLDAAFGGQQDEAEFEHDRLQLEPDRLIGAVDGEAWVGAGGAFSFRMTVPGGGEVGAAGITMIGVSPSHRRRGILRQMMRWLLDQAGERGEPVAILWASEGAIYQRFGYGIGTLQGTFDIERTRVRFARPTEPIGRMRLVDRDEAIRLIPPVYDAVRSRMPGAVSRHDVKWRHELLDDAEWMRRGNGPKFIAVLEVDGAARGYAIYRVKNEWDERGPNNTVLALEVAGLDAAAERAVWEWLFGIDLVGHVKGWRVPAAHPLMLQLTEPRRLGMNVRDGLVAAHPDARAALEARSYNGPGSIAFELTDEFCPSNAGTVGWRWPVVVPCRAPGSGLGRLTGDPDLTLDTSDLAAVYLGAFSFTDLARAGRVGECRPGAIAAADGLFATAVAPWCATMF
jgi:predicted acetyltransferase